MKNILLISFLALVLLQGCVSAPVERSISHEHALSVKDAQVFIRFKQKELLTYIPGSTIGGDFGLVGKAIDAYEDYKSYNKMHSIVSPVNAATSDIRWGDSLGKALASQNIFANPKAITVLNNTESNNDIGELINGATKPWVLVIDGQYYLDPWYRVLTVAANISLYDRGNNQPVHEFRSVYYSRPIATEMEMSITGKHTSRWADSNGKAFRASHQEGVNEVAELIKAALVDRPSNVPSEQDVMYEYMDWDMQVNHPVEAKLIKEKVKRAVLIEDDGRFLSVPIAETYLSSNEASRSLARNKARIYLYQKKDMIAPYPEVYSNNKHVGAIYPNSYLVLDVTPGEHSFTLKFEGELVVGTSLAKKQFEEIEPVIINAVTGNTYYIRFDGYRGLFTPDDALKLVNPDISTSEIANLSLSY